MSAGLEEFDESETPLLITASKLAALLEVSTRTLWRLPEPVRLGGAGAAGRGCALAARRHPELDRGRLPGAARS
jgi:hypothetical protein